MWLCQRCDERHLDSQPVCQRCGGMRADVGRAHNPDTEPLSAEEVRRSAAFARLHTAVLDQQTREEAIAPHVTPWGRQAVRLRFFVTDIQTAYRNMRRRGSGHAAWWLLGGLVAGTLTLLLGPMLSGWPLPSWLWLLAWIAASGLALGIIRRDRATGRKPG